MMMPITCVLGAANFIVTGSGSIRALATPWSSIRYSTCFIFSLRSAPFA